jgi:hypothetical protein
VVARQSHGEQGSFHQPLGEEVRKCNAGMGGFARLFAIRRNLIGGGTLSRRLIPELVPAGEFRRVKGAVLIAPQSA